MNTKFMLLAEFETGEIPLGAVAEKYLGLSAKKANEQARSQSLPFPAYRCGSQKSQWLVAIDDLAEYLDAQKEAARQDWRRVKGAA